MKITTKRNFQIHFCYRNSWIYPFNTLRRAFRVQCRSGRITLTTILLPESTGNIWRCLDDFDYKNVIRRRKVCTGVQRSPWSGRCGCYRRREIRSRFSLGLLCRPTTCWWCTSCRFPLSTQPWLPAGLFYFVSISYDGSGTKSSPATITRFLLQ